MFVPLDSAFAEYPGSGAAAVAVVAPGRLIGLASGGRLTVASPSVPSISSLSYAAAGEAVSAVSAAASVASSAVSKTSGPGAPAETSVAAAAGRPAERPPMLRKQQTAARPGRGPQTSVGPVPAVPRLPAVPSVPAGGGAGESAGEPAAQPAPPGRPVRSFAGPAPRPLALGASTGPVKPLPRPDLGPYTPGRELADPPPHRSAAPARARDLLPLGVGLALIGAGAALIGVRLRRNW